MQEQEQNKINKPTTTSQEKLVETYAGDMADIIGQDQGGFIKNIIHEEEARENEKKNFSPESRKNKIFIFSGILLLVLGLGTLTFLFINRGKIGTVPVENSLPMIFTNKTTFLEVSELSKDQIMAAVVTEADQTKMKRGEIEGFFITLNKKILGLREFVTLLKSTLVLGDPQLVNNNFLLGVYAGETKNPFVLIKMRSMPDIFDSLHNWEPKMFYDLHRLFGVDITADTNYLLTKNLEDSIVENKNGRTLYGTNGDIVFMYVFVDETHTLITNNLAVVHEIIVRLAGSKVKQ